MSDRAALLALADRVEQATGPDFALGVEVLRACDRPITDVNPLFSLDAAVSLVPGGHAFSLHVDADGSVFAGVKLDDGDGCDDARPCGATPALALCAAALRARAANTEREG